MTPLTKVLSAIALGIGANTDNLAVGFAYGLRGKRIGMASNLLIAVLTTAATLLALGAGFGLRHLIPPAAPDLLGGVILVGLGLRNIWLRRRKGREQPDPNPPIKVGSRIGIGETLTLAAALSVNNLGLGFAGGMGGLHYGAVGVSVGGFSILSLWLGQFFSKASVHLPAPLRGLALDGDVLIVVVGVLMMIGV
jgi:putative Mn2+ efflux pump MntP